MTYEVSESNQIITQIQRTKENIFCCLELAKMHLKFCDVTNAFQMRFD